MGELENYPRPWRTTTTPRAHKTGGGYNYHIRAANGMYVAERLMGGENVAALIVESVNERKESIASLRTQLATMAELNNSQREILHAVAVQRDEAVARAEAAEAQALQLRLDLGAAVERANKTAIELLALQVDRSKSVKLRDETDNVLWTLKPADVPGAINWGDLGVREVQEVINEERCWWRVIIEEADPSNPALHAAVMAGLTALGWNADDIELETAW